VKGAFGENRAVARLLGVGSGHQVGGISRRVVAIGLERRSGHLLATPKCTGIALPGAGVKNQNRAGNQHSRSSYPAFWQRQGQRNTEPLFLF